MYKVVKLALYHSVLFVNLYKRYITGSIRGKITTVERKDPALTRRDLQQRSARTLAAVVCTYMLSFKDHVRT